MLMIRIIRILIPHYFTVHDITSVQVTKSEVPSASNEKGCQENGQAGIGAHNRLRTGWFVYLLLGLSLVMLDISCPHAIMLASHFSTAYMHVLATHLLLLVANNGTITASFFPVRRSPVPST